MKRILRWSCKILLLLMCLSCLAAIKAGDEEFDWQMWERILYYDVPILGTSSSLINDKRFFLSPEGHKNSWMELNEFLSLVEKENAKGFDATKSVVCRFPWRFIWLSKQGLINRNDIHPENVCPKLKAYLNIAPKKALSIIFSSQYMGNPASYFGHTFLLLKRNHLSQNNQATMLDSAIGFAANVPNAEKTFEYAWNGLTGGFLGLFTIEPFFMKVQEYNFLEQRDLWEYEVKVNEMQIKNLLLAFWEVKDIGIPYFYLNNNCTKMLQKLLAATDARFASLEQKIWTSPLTFIRKLEDKKFIGTKIFRPSMYAQCVENSKSLSQSDKRFIKRAFKSRILKKDLLPQSVVQKIRVLDFLVDYIDYHEKTAGSIESLEYGQLRHEVLLARSELGSERQDADTGKKIDKKLKVNGPEKAHKEMLLTAGFFKSLSDDAAGAVMRFRPSFHEFGDPSIGIGHENAVSILGLEGRISHRTSELSKVTFISMSSHPYHTELIDLWSWEIAVEGNTYLRDSKLAQADKKDLSVRLGGGISFGRSDKNLLFGIIPFAIAGGSLTREVQGFGASGITYSMIWRPFSASNYDMKAIGSNKSLESMEFMLQWHPSFVKTSREYVKRFIDHKAQVSWSYSPDIFIQLQLKKSGFFHEGEISFGGFF